MAYKINQSNRPSEFNSGLQPVLYASSDGFLLGDCQVKQIPLTQGKFAIVDDADCQWLNQFKWCAYKGNSTYYAIRGDGKRNTIRMHREILNSPKGLCTDHRNGNGLDNRRKNLRVCTNAENLQNQTKRARCTSKYKGVTTYSVVKHRKRPWLAQITFNNKHINIGYFASEESAARAYDIAAKKYHGEFARLNFPNDQIRLRDSSCRHKGGRDTWCWP